MLGPLGDTGAGKGRKGGRKGRRESSVTSLCFVIPEKWTYSVDLLQSLPTYQVERTKVTLEHSGDLDGAHSYAWGLACKRCALVKDLPS